MTAQPPGLTTLLLLIGVSAAAISAYGFAMWCARARGRDWPARRLASWAVGCLMAAWAMWPITELGGEWMFTQHMIDHVLLGMAAPLLLVLARPVGLLLCALPQRGARRVTRWFDTLYVRVVMHPVVAAFLDIGALWVLYRTPLFHTMHEHAWLDALVHLHVFAAGCLFTATITQIEPTRHRHSFALRAGVLVAAIAAHDILAKHLYADESLGMSPGDTQRGAMLMYYLGDAVDVLLVIVVCADWYRRAGRCAEVGAVGLDAVMNAAPR